MIYSIDITDLNKGIVTIMTMTSHDRIELFNQKDIEKHPFLDPQGDEKRLFEAFKDDNLVVFYGAGVSRIAQCASWPELAVEIVKAFSKAQHFSEQDKELLSTMAYQDPRKVISICYHRAKREGPDLMNIYEESIKCSVTPKNKEEFKRIHRKIYELDPIAYVTTNIDKGIEEVIPNRLKKKPINLAQEEIIPDLKGLIKNGNIFYLHGEVDDIKNTIFTVENYYKFYQKQKIHQFLKEIFRGEYCVLFIGYSLAEHEVLQNIFLSIKEEKRDEKHHFLLSPIYSKDLAEFNINKMFFDIYSVKAIPFFIDYEGYSRLYHALSKLIATKDEIRPSDLEDISLIDRV